MSGETFATLLEPNLKSVRKFVHLRAAKSPDRADDIVQQTLLHAFQHRAQLRTPAKFKSWLYSIAVNEIRMAFRPRRQAVPLHEVAPVHLHYRGISPDQAMEQTERQEWLDFGMSQLSARDRQAIRLRDIDCLSIAETAEVLNTSEAATKSVHFRARRRLAQALRETSVGQASTCAEL